MEVYLTDVRLPQKKYANAYWWCKALKKEGNSVDIASQAAVSDVLKKYQQTILADEDRVFSSAARQEDKYTREQ